MCSCHDQVVFSKSAEDQIHQLAEDPSANDEAKRAARMLQNSVNVINQVRMKNSRETHHYYGSCQHVACAFSSKGYR